MKSFVATLVFAGALGSAASATTLQQEDLLGAGAWSFAAPIVLVQQISIPVVVNQALAIGILSDGVTAIANANVVSANFATVVIGESEAWTSYPDEEPLAFGEIEHILRSTLGLAIAESLDGILKAVDQLAFLDDFDFDNVLGHPPGEGGVTQVPVPPALLLAATAFGGLTATGWLRRRRLTAAR